MPLGLLALAIGGFGIGLTEFVIMGLLPEVAARLRRLRDRGRLADLRLRAERRGRRRRASPCRGTGPPQAVLMALMVLFIVGNLLSAVAPDLA